MALSFGATLFAEGSVQVKTQSAKEKPVEEKDKALDAGGSLGKAIFENLTSGGLLKLTGTTVKQKLKVEGILLTQSAHLGSVEVRGEANFKNTDVSQAMEAIGTMRAEKSQFKGPVTLGGTKATFIGSSAASVTMRKEDAFRGTQVIELKQKTIIDGPIVFESGKGEVHCYPGSLILGPVTGGKVVKKK